MVWPADPWAWLARGAGALRRPSAPGAPVTCAPGRLVHGNAPRLRRLDYREGGMRLEVDDGHAPRWRPAVNHGEVRAPAVGRNHHLPHGAHGGEKRRDPEDDERAVIRGRDDVDQR